MGLGINILALIAAGYFAYFYTVQAANAMIDSLETYYTRLSYFWVIFALFKLLSMTSFYGGMYPVFVISNMITSTMSLLYIAQMMRELFDL